MVSVSGWLPMAVAMVLGARAWLWTLSSGKGCANWGMALPAMGTCGLCAAPAAVPRQSKSADFQVNRILCPPGVVPSPPRCASAMPSVKPLRQAEPIDFIQLLIGVPEPAWRTFCAAGRFLSRWASGKIVCMGQRFSRRSILAGAAALALPLRAAGRPKTPPLFDHMLLGCGDLDKG